MPDRDFNPKDGRWFYISFEMAEALSKAHLDISAMSVLLCVMKHAYPAQRPWADLRLKTIMDYTDLSKTSCYRGISNLEDRKILKIRPVGGTKFIKRYRINSKKSSWKKGPFAGKNHLREKKGPSAGIHPIKDTNKIKGNFYSEKKGKKKAPRKIDPWFVNLANEILKEQGRAKALEYLKQVDLPVSILKGG